jgi:DNA-binding transcriptional LysR family regulator
MDPISDLSLFLRVLDAGSISGAARRSGISVAVASKRLERLERRLGVRLVHRTTRRLEPTSEGAWLAERGRSSIEEIEALTESLRQSQRDITGRLRVSVSTSFGRLHVSPLLPSFLAQHPRVALDVHFSDHLVDLAASDLDLALRIGTLDDSNLVARRLAVDRRVLCASPEYLRRRGAPESPADLAAHDCLVQRGGPGPRATWRLSDGAGGLVAVRVRGRFETNLGDAVRDAALAGLGIAQHSTWRVCDDLRAGRLNIVLPRHPPQEGGIYAVTRERRKPARVRAFIDFIAARFGERAPWEHPALDRPSGAE